SPNWILGAELGVRKTFTDHLDDVGGMYPDLNALRQKEGNTAAALSDRSGELVGSEQLSQQGDFRGDSQIKDWYYIAGITLTYRFTPIRCMFTKN
ncbi:MAG: hypothetical protein LPK45_09075, partial [Bacteroidota bacterium]|nr:hypothetical protein [Bacteroidota bacterium]MDX5431235.1 hypothetical protein [Bacteroidota bacterium]MDX5469974.1 hypothetical protein [Bacteroidota bacterium]